MGYQKHGMLESRLIELLNELLNESITYPSVEDTRLYTYSRKRMKLVVMRSNRRGLDDIYLYSCAIG